MDSPEPWLTVTTTVKNVARSSVPVEEEVFFRVLNPKLTERERILLSKTAEFNRLSYGRLIVSVVLLPLGFTSALIASSKESLLGFAISAVLIAAFFIVQGFEIVARRKYNQSEYEKMLKKFRTMKPREQVSETAKIKKAHQDILPQCRQLEALLETLPVEHTRKLRELLFEAVHAYQDEGQEAFQPLFEEFAVFNKTPK